MATHPYKGLDKAAFWRNAITNTAAEEVDPVGRTKFTLASTDRVATAGSCFAQHIPRHLSNAGFNYLVTEPAHPLIPQHIADSYSYGLFTARYANIYTSRQLVQLLQRAYGLFTPMEDRWDGPDGRLIDPFRPQIQPGGFSTAAEFERDREQHFTAIRTMVETLDCFVFTLGLTESWSSREDGAVFPLCPGTAGGTFDPDRHMFHNLTTVETIEDLVQMRSFILDRNAKARFILTVSPVPLVATASGNHVLTATTHSKSVLRAAAGEFAAAHDDVAYFPSYEIITGNFNRGAYFADDLRSVREDGVAHVMRLFLKHYGGYEADAPPSTVAAASSPPVAARSHEALTRVVCDEEMLEKFG